MKDASRRVFSYSRVTLAKRSKVERASAREEDDTTKFRSQERTSGARKCETIGRSQAVTQD